MYRKAQCVVGYPSFVPILRQENRPCPPYGPDFCRKSGVLCSAENGEGAVVPKIFPWPFGGSGAYVVQGGEGNEGGGDKESKPRNSTRLPMANASAMAGPFRFGLWFSDFGKKPVPGGVSAFERRQPAHEFAGLLAAAMIALDAGHHDGGIASDGLAVGSEDQFPFSVGFIRGTLAKLRLEQMRDKLVLVRAKWVVCGDRSNCEAEREINKSPVIGVLFGWMRRRTRSEGTGYTAAGSFRRARAHLTRRCPSTLISTV
uniref:Uncharacterized protein n=1 Tax=Candidatus Kentrum sp. DK TaxID=2126562 RepID=A0A450T5Y2_9GAMM|nr:MAG: hypothetical protein BECKDK2373C_GA0170839_10941 [Candidatus Kentron sp. DK]